MSDKVPPPGLPGDPAPSGPSRAEVPAARRRRSRFSPVWILPLLALAVAGYLAFTSIRTEGPTITVTFKSGDGLVAGQTRVLHKAVQLGTVQNVRLADNLQSVVVTLKMLREADPYLTDQARFWVVRPRLSSGSFSGFETLLSGSYIEMDPGARGGPRQAEYTGLENPPGVRSGEPGRTYKLKSPRLGSLTAGAPVFYRDITVGEVLGYDLGDGVGPVTVTVFVRDPYDNFVRQGSHFWNASGLSVQVNGDGVHVEVASMQALLSGGVAFDTPRVTPSPPSLPDGSEFPLYRNYDDAQAAGYTKRQNFVTYFDTSVRGLTKGSSVEFFGIQIGTVTDVALDVDPQTARARAKVKFEVQPERIGTVNASLSAADDLAVARRLVAKGARAQLKTASYLTGSMVLAMDFVPNTPPAELRTEGDEVVVPSVGGGLDNILTAVSDIASKLDRLPLDEIGANLNGTLRAASGAATSIQGLATRADAGLSPVLSRLPALMASLQDTVAKAGRTVGTLGSSYGADSPFNRELSRALVQVGDTARSIRLLADYLDRHPEALIRGRADYGVTR